MTPVAALITYVALNGQVFSAPPSWFDTLEDCQHHQQHIMKTSDPRHFPVIAECVSTRSIAASANSADKPI